MTITAAIAIACLLGGFWLGWRIALGYTERRMIAAVNNSVEDRSTRLRVYEEYMRQ
jgi:hypothetical protein